MNKVLLATSQMAAEADTGELIKIALIAMGLLVVLVGIFILLFLFFSFITNKVLLLVDKYYEKTGKKRPVNIKRQRNRRNY